MGMWLPMFYSKWREIEKNSGNVDAWDKWQILGLFNLKLPEKIKQSTLHLKCQEITLWQDQIIDNIEKT